MVVTNNKKLYEKLKIIRNQGQIGRYNHVLLGNNFRMTDIMASIGIEQVKKIKKITTEKNKIANFYNKELSKIYQIQIPYIPKYVTQHSWYNYSIKVDEKFRNKLVKYLKKNGIETRLSFPPIHIQPYYVKKFKYKKNLCPNAYKAYLKFIDLPIWFGLKKEFPNKNNKCN